MNDNELVVKKSELLLILSELESAASLIRNLLGILPSELEQSPKSVVKNNEMLLKPLKAFHPMLYLDNIPSFSLRLRTIHALQYIEILYVWQLVKLDYNEFLLFEKNVSLFGRTSKRDIIALVKALGLTFSTKFSEAEIEYLESQTTKK
jgi:hypothetical protein